MCTNEERLKCQFGGRVCIFSPHALVCMSGKSAHKEGTVKDKESEQLDEAEQYV